VHGNALERGQYAGRVHRKPAALGVRPIPGQFRGSQLALGQIHQCALHHRTVLHRRHGLWRKVAAMVLPTRAVQLMAAMLGHLQHRPEQIKHLTPVLSKFSAGKITLPLGSSN